MVLHFLRFIIFQLILSDQLFSIFIGFLQPGVHVNAIRPPTKSRGAYPYFTPMTLRLTGGFGGFFSILYGFFEKKKLPP